MDDKKKEEKLLEEELFFEDIFIGKIMFLEEEFCFIEKGFGQWIKFDEFSEEFFKVVEEVGCKVVDVFEWVGKWVIDVSDKINECFFEEGEKFWDKVKEKGSSFMDCFEDFVDKVNEEVEKVFMDDLMEKVKVMDEELECWVKECG